LASANDGFGAATATFTGIDVVDSESISFTLHPLDKPNSLGTQFNTFGIQQSAVGSGTVDFFIDNLQYSIPEPSPLAVMGLVLTLALRHRKAAVI
jgi:hypothetical protein